MQCANANTHLPCGWGLQVLSACVHLQLTPTPQLLAALQEQSYEQLPRSSPRDTTSMLWALARLSVHPSRQWLQRALSCWKHGQSSGGRGGSHFAMSAQVRLAAPLVCWWLAC